MDGMRVTWDDLGQLYVVGKGMRELGDWCSVMFSVGRCVGET